MSINVSVCMLMFTLALYWRYFYYSEQWWIQGRLEGAAPSPH